MKDVIKFTSGTIFIVFLVLLSFVLLSKTSYATNMQVTKKSVDQIKIGDVLQVTININNLESSATDVTVKETIAGADPVNPPEFYIVKCPPGVRFCVEPPYYSWNVTLSPNSIYSITYKIKPLTLGDFNIPATKVTNSSGEIFYSNSLHVLVLCNSNGICETNLFENYFNCPQDCPSGSKDGVCDLIKDGRCDPDCAPGADPDCVAGVTTTQLPAGPICGNNICELGETSETCPQDCGTKPSGTGIPFYVYIIIIIIIIPIVILFIRKLRVQTS